MPCTPGRLRTGKAIECLYRLGFNAVLIWPMLESALFALDSPVINAVLNPAWEAKTPYGRIKERFYRCETYTSRLLEAMRITYERMGKSRLINS